jgi:hypothetical protein
VEVSHNQAEREVHRDPTRWLLLVWVVAIHVCELWPEHLRLIWLALLR